MGGRKTFGVIYNEALNLLKVNYWQMFGVGAIVTVATFIMMALVLCVFMFFYLLFMLITPMGMLFLWTYVDNPGGLPVDGGPTAAFITVTALLFLVFFIVYLAAVFAGNIVIQTANVCATDGTLRLACGGKLTMPELWGSVRRNWKRYLGISAWSLLWSYLWMLLFYIPGIYKYVSYMLAPALVVHYPQMGVRDALKKSMEISAGFRGRLFLILMVTFAFTAAANLIAFCFAPLLIVALMFWIYPMQFAMMAVAYLDIRQTAVEKGLLPGDDSESTEGLKGEF